MESCRIIDATVVYTRDPVNLHGRVHRGEWFSTRVITLNKETIYASKHCNVYDIELALMSI